MSMAITKAPLKKSLNDIAIEEAHGGSGSRQVLFSAADTVSSQFEAWTKGFLPPGKSYDWHHHDGVDEFFIVLSGTGTITYEGSEPMSYKADDVFYNPENLPHRIENTGTVDSVFYFIRVKG